jgi:hypothetical protein
MTPSPRRKPAPTTAQLIRLAAWRDHSGDLGVFRRLCAAADLVEAAGAC